MILQKTYHKLNEWIIMLDSPDFKGTDAELVRKEMMEFCSEIWLNRYEELESNSELNSQEINLSGDVRNEIALQQSNSFEPKTCRLCDTARNDKSKVAPKIKNKYGQYMENDDLGRNEVGRSCKDLSNGTDKLCNSPDVYSTESVINSDKLEGEQGRKQ